MNPHASGMLLWSPILAACSFRIGACLSLLTGGIFVHFAGHCFMVFSPTSLDKIATFPVGGPHPSSRPTPLLPAHTHVVTNTNVYKNHVHNQALAQPYSPSLGCCNCSCSCGTAAAGKYSKGPGSRPRALQSTIDGRLAQTNTPCLNPNHLGTPAGSGQPQKSIPKYTLRGFSPRLCAPTNACPGVPATTADSLEAVLLKNNVSGQPRL